MTFPTRASFSSPATPDEEASSRVWMADHVLTGAGRPSTPP